MKTLLVLIVILCFATGRAHAAFPLHTACASRSADTTYEQGTRMQTYSHTPDYPGGAFGILSFVCAIVSYPVSFYGALDNLFADDPSMEWFVLALILAIIAFTAGIAGISRKLKGLAIAGLVLGTLMMVLMLFELTLEG